MKGLEGQTMWGKAYRGFGQGWFHATESAMCLLNIFWQVFNFVNACGVARPKGEEWFSFKGGTIHCFIN